MRSSQFSTVFFIGTRTDGLGVSLGSMGAIKIWKDPVVGVWSVQDLFVPSSLNSMDLYGPNLWQMWDDRWGQE